MNFSWWKDEDIKKSSVFVLEDSKDLNDLRLGATTAEPCQTCFLKWKFCPGHFSYYEFKYPIIHPMLLSAAKKDLRKYNLKLKTFQNCIQINKDGTRGALTVFDIPTELKEKNPFWLKKIIPISPTCIRPSCVTERGLSMNDLTHRLASLIRIDKTLRNSCTNNTFNIDDHKRILQRLQLAFTLFFFPPSGARESRELSNISDRFKGKEGRFRQSNLGKRIEFSARSVITGDSFIDVDEVGVPIEVCEKLTRPVMVNRYNKDKLSEDLFHNKIKYISKRVQDRDSSNLNEPWKVENLSKIEQEDVQYRMVDPKFNREGLKIGDIVHKKLEDGDYVLLNRQPSLWKSSIQSMRVRKLPCKTFRLNVEITPCFNADFDGDEMNIYLPQSVSCAGELKYTMHASENIINGGAGIVQDSALGSYFLTLPTTIVRKTIYFDCIYRIKDACMSQDTLQKPYTGRKLFSCLLENDLNIKDLVKNGQVICTLNKKKIKKKILKEIYKRSPQKALAFLGSLQKICAEYLRTRGFSIGISALEPDKEIRRCDPSFCGITGDQWYLLQKGRKEREAQALQIQKLFSKDNNFISLTSEGSGAKGSLVNIVQMRCSLGQQYYKGGLLPNFRGDRVLSCDKFGDDSIVNKGFITGNFLDGLSPKELFQHAISSRLSLLDTALKTAETGYSSRRLSFSLQDIIVQYDNTIRDGKRILRFDSECLLLGGNAVEPGHPLGIEASQMIGQMVMQLTLNSFHSAGEAQDITSGVPRMEALINNWRKKQGQQRLLYKNNVQSKEGHDEIRKYDYQTLGTFILKYEKNDSEIKMKLNKVQLIKNRIHLWDIHIAVLNSFSSNIIPRLKNYELIIKTKDDATLPTKEEIYNTRLRGIKKGQKVFWTNNTLSYKNFDIEMFKNNLNLFYKIRSTDINETMKLLGVEAARAQLLIELKKVFNNGVESLYLEVLVEYMLFLGEISAITRSGLKKSKPSVLKNMAFERSLRVAADSATANLDAVTDGTAENIILNNRIQQGTGIVSLATDKKIQNEIEEHNAAQKKRRFDVVHDDDEPWLKFTDFENPSNIMPTENPFVGGGGFGFNAQGIMPGGMMMMPSDIPLSPAYDFDRPISPAYDPFAPDNL